MKRVLITGGSGFIGTAVANCVRDVPDCKVRWAIHKNPPPVRDLVDESIFLDLANPSGLPTALAGVDAVIHLGHRLIGSPLELEAVNSLGASALAKAAQKLGISVTSVSNASVYGRGPWKSQEIHELKDDPQSLVSSTRAAGDQAILANGGAVIRPHFVLGTGDRWVVPRAAAIVERWGWVNAGVTHTTIGVNHLAAQLVHTAVYSHRPGVHLAGTATTSELQEAVEHHLALHRRRPARRLVPLDEAMRTAPESAHAQLVHDYLLLSQEHELLCNCPSLPGS